MVSVCFVLEIWLLGRGVIHIEFKSVPRMVPCNETSGIVSFPCCF